MSGTANQVFVPSGGVAYDNGGENIITAGGGAATVFASLGTDTIVGGSGSLLATATEDGNSYNSNDLTVLAGDGALDFTPGDGNNSVLGGAGPVTIETGDTLFEGGLEYVGGTGPATVWGSFGGTTVTGGLGPIQFDQIGVATINAGPGTITVLADGNPLQVVGADGVSVPCTPGTNDVLEIVTDRANHTTVTDTTTGQVLGVHSIDGSRGGSFFDVAGANLITLGAGAATVTASRGNDTIVGGSGALTVDASGDAHPLLVEASAAAAGTNVLGGSGPTTLLQHGATTITAGTGAVTLTSDGSPLCIIGLDGTTVPTWSVANGDVVTITADSATRATTVADPNAHQALTLAGRQVLDRIDGAGGGVIHDVLGQNQVTLGSAAATVVASAGSDTILGGSGALTVLAGTDLHSLEIDAGAATGTTVQGGSGPITLRQHGATTITAGTGAISVISDGGALTVVGDDGASSVAGWQAGAGDTVTISTDANQATKIVDAARRETLLLAGRQATHLVDASAGGLVLDYAGANQITLGGVAATVTASAAGIDTVLGGSGRLTVDATANTRSVVIAADPRATGTTVLGGSGTVSLSQHGATSIAAGSGTINVTADGNTFAVRGADGLETYAFAAAAGDEVQIRTDAHSLATTINDVTTGRSTMLQAGNFFTPVDGTAGGAVSDVGGRVRITLGTAPATVTAALGVDTIVGMGGPLTVDASADANALTVTGSTGGTTIKGGAGTINVAQHGATAITAGTGLITVRTTGGSPLVVTGYDRAETATLTPAAADLLTIQYDPSSHATVITDTATNRRLQLGGGQALNLLDGAGGGSLSDVAGSNLITLGAAAATVVASLGADTIRGNTVPGASGPLTVNATGNANPLDIVAGIAALTFIPGSGPATVYGSAAGATDIRGGGGTLAYYDQGGNATVAGAAQGTNVVDNGGSVVLTQAGPTTVQAGIGTVTIHTNGSTLDITGNGVSTTLDRTWRSGETLVLGRDGANTTVSDGHYTYTIGAAGVSTSGGLAGPVDLLAGEGASLYAALLGALLAAVPGEPGNATYFGPGDPMPASGLESLLVRTGAARAVAVPAGVKLARNEFAGTDLQGNGAFNQFITSSAGFTYHANGGSGAVLADDVQAGGRAGNNHIVLGPSGGNFLLVTGSGNDTVEAGSGNDTIAAGGGDNQIFLGSGDDLVTSAGNDFILSGGGAATVQATAGSQALVFGNRNSLLFLGGAGEAATVVGGSGGSTMVGGSGSSLFWGGGIGGNVMFAGAGASTLVGGGAGNVLHAGGSGDELLVAGTGSSTLLGGSATGNDTYLGSGGDDLIITDSGNDLVIGGPGHDTIDAGRGNALVFGGQDGTVLRAPVAGGTVNFISDGGGPDIFAFANGQGGGTDIIWGFRPGVDRIALAGYGPNEASNASAGAHPFGAGTELFLSDNTRVVFGDVVLPPNGFG